MFRSFIILIAFIISSPAHASETWTSYTDNSESSTIRNMTISGEYLWIATNGGAIRLNRLDGTTKTFHRADGLADNVVNTVAVDSSGAVWFGTEWGLSRFDGTQWTTWTTADGLANNDVSGIAFDASGTIWITMNGEGNYGKDYFNWSILQSFNGTSFVTHISGKSAMGGGFQALGIDPVHRWLWSWDFYGAVRIDPVSFQTKYFQASYGYPQSIPSAFDSTGTAWFVSNGQYRTFDGAVWSSPEPSDTTLTGSLLSMVMDRNGIKWFSTTKGIARFDGGSWKMFISGVSEERSTRLCAIDDNGYIWGVSSRGITRFDGEKLSIFSTGVILPGNYVRSMAVDRDNIKWFGLTGSRGVSSFDGATWRYYTADDGLAMEEIGDSVFAIAVDSTNVKWFGTWTWLTRFDGKVWKSFTSEVSRVMTLAVDKNNVLWVGTYNGEVKSFDGTNWITRNPGTNRINCITDGPEDQIWAGGEDYLFSYKRSWSHITDGPPNNCGALLWDRTKTLWVASGNGSPTGTTRFRDGVWEQRVSLPLPLDAPIHSMAEDANGIIWVAASGNGNWYKRGQGAASFDGKTWTAYTTQNSGLVDNGVWAVAVDKDNVKWFATEAGVCSLKDTGDEHFLHITSPVGGSQWAAGVVQNIIWQAKGITGITIEYSPDGVAWKTLADSISASTGSWKWNCFENVSSHARIRISEKGNSSLAALSPEFTILFPSYATDRGAWTYFPYPALLDSILQKENLGYLDVSAIAADHDAGIWIGGNSHILRLKKNIWTSYDPSITKFKGNISFIRADHNNNIWIGSDEGEYLRRFDGNNWRSYFFRELSRIYDIAEDQDGVLWLAHYTGIIQMNPDDSYKAYSKWSGNFKYQSALSVAVDKNNRKWFGVFEPTGADMLTRPGELLSFDGSVWKAYTDSTVYKDFAGKVINHLSIGTDNSVFFSIPQGKAFMLSDTSVKTIADETGVQGIETDKVNDVWMILKKYKSVPTSAERPFYYSIRWIHETKQKDFDSNESLFDWFTSVAVDDKGAKWFATHHGLWRFEDIYTPTSVIEAKEPSQFGLLVNYPNPFNPSTTISFTLSEEGKASLIVYDITGRKVRQLLSGYLSAGAGSSVWDGRDDSGRTVSSGVYYARLTVGNHAAVGKMLLMK